MLVPVTISYHEEGSEEFEVRLRKRGEVYKTKTFTDPVDALEYVGWVEAFYRACGVEIEEVIL